MRARGGERVLGPYPERAGYRVIQIDAAGHRETVVFETEAKADRYVEILRADLAREEETTNGAIDKYKAHLTEKGDRDPSIAVTEWAIRKFFPTAQALSLLSATSCQKRYDDLRASKKKDGTPIAVDTHRNILAQTKSFLAWCVEKGWMRENPCAAVKGIGKRRPRGKSLGKEGRTLRVKEARRWFKTALGLADDGDEGAIASLVGLLLGMRASEITSRRVEDLDEDAAPGDLLWIPCAKTPAGRRTLEGHLIAATLGHDEERTTFDSYAAPGAAAAGANRRGLVLLNGGVQDKARPAKAAK